MIRIEVKTPHKRFVSCEANMPDAKAYIEGLKRGGVEILSVKYFDRDAREATIQSGHA